MNIRAATLFFWFFLIAGAAVAGEEYRSETKMAVDSGGDEPQVFEWHSDELDAEQVHGEHEVIIRKEIEKTTN